MKQTLSVRETAGRLGCTLKYVYDLLYAGKLQSTKQSREWRISTRAVEKWIKGHGAKNGQ